MASLTNSLDLASHIDDDDLSVENHNEFISETSGFLCVSDTLGDIFYFDDKMYKTFQDLFDIAFKVEGPISMEVQYMHKDLDGEQVKKVPQNVASMSQEDRWRMLIDLSFVDSVLALPDKLKGLHVASMFQVPTGESIIWSAEIQREISIEGLGSELLDIPDSVKSLLLGDPDDPTFEAADIVPIDGTNNFILAKELLFVKGEI